MDTNGMTRDDLLGASFLAWGSAGLLALYLLAHPAAGTAGRPWGVVVGLVGVGLALLARRPWTWPVLAGPLALVFLPTRPAAATLAGSALLAVLLALGERARRRRLQRPARRPQLYTGGRATNQGTRRGPSSPRDKIRRRKARCRCSCAPRPRRPGRANNRLRRPAPLAQDQVPSSRFGRGPGG